MRLQGDWSSDVCSSDLSSNSSVSRSSACRRLSSKSGNWSLLGTTFRRLRRYSHCPATLLMSARSEERRVGKECRSRWSQYEVKEKRKLTERRNGKKKE